MASASCVAPSSDSRRRRAAQLNFELPSFSLGIDTEAVRPASDNQCAQVGSWDVDICSGEKSANQQFAVDADVGAQGSEQRLLGPEDGLDPEAGRVNGYEERPCLKRLKRGPSSLTTRATVDDALPDGSRKEPNALGCRTLPSNGERPVSNLHADPDGFLATGHDCATARHEDLIVSTPGLEKKRKLSLCRRVASPCTPLLQTCSNRRELKMPGTKDVMKDSSKHDAGVSKCEMSCSQRTLNIEDNSKSQSLQHVKVPLDDHADDIEDISDDECVKGFQGVSTFSWPAISASPPLNVSSSQKPSLHVYKADVQSKLQYSPLKVSRAEGSKFSFNENDSCGLDDFQIRSDQWGVARHTSKNRVQNGRSPRQKAGVNPSAMNFKPGTARQPVVNSSKETFETIIHQVPPIVRQGNTIDDMTCEADPFSVEDSHCNADGWRRTRHTYAAPTQDRSSSRRPMSGASPILITSSPEDLGKPTLHIPGVTGETQQQAKKLPQCTSSRNTTEGSSLGMDDFSLDDFEWDLSGWRNTRHDIDGGQSQQQRSTFSSNGVRSDVASGRPEVRQQHDPPSSDIRWNGSVARSSQTSQPYSTSGSEAKRSEPLGRQAKSKQFGLSRDGNIKNFFTKTPVRSDTIGPSRAVGTNRGSLEEERQIKEYLRRRLPHYKSVDALLVDGGLDNEPVYIDYRTQFAEGQDIHAPPPSEVTGSFKQWPPVRSIRGAFSPSPEGGSFSRKKNTKNNKAASRGRKKKQSSSQGESSAGGHAQAAKKGAGEGKWTMVNGTRVFVVDGSRMSGRQAYVAYRKGRGGFPSKKKGKKRPASKSK